VRSPDHQRRPDQGLSRLSNDAGIQLRPEEGAQRPTRPSAAMPGWAPYRRISSASPCFGASPVDKVQVEPPGVGESLEVSAISRDQGQLP
jgi:hypothetical protein